MKKEQVIKQILSQQGKKGGSVKGPEGIYAPDGSLGGFGQRKVESFLEVVLTTKELVEFPRQNAKDSQLEMT